MALTSILKNATTTAARTARQVDSEREALERERDTLSATIDITTAEITKAATELELGEGSATAEDIARRRRDLVAGEARLVELDAMIAAKRSAADVLRGREKRAKDAADDAAAADLYREGIRRTEELADHLAAIPGLVEKIEAVNNQLRRYGGLERDDDGQLVNVGSRRRGFEADDLALPILQPKEGLVYVPTLKDVARRWHEAITGSAKAAKARIERRGSE